MTDNSQFQEKGRMYHLDIDSIQADPDQPRKTWDGAALEELAASIARHGVLQPVLFRLDAAGKPMLVAGERRLQAARQAMLATVPGILVDGEPAEIALVENLLRQDLTVVEEAEALKALMDRQGYTQEQLAAALGKGRSTVTEILSLNRLPELIRDQCRGDRTIPRAVLVTIAKKVQSRAMLTAFEHYRQKAQRGPEGQTARPPQEKTAAVLVEQVEKMTKALVAANAAVWDDRQKAALAGALADLRQRIDDLSPSLTVAPARPR